MTTNQVNNNSTLGVILAGGRASRLGGVLKANIEIGGLTLFDRVKTMIETDCSPVVLSIGQHQKNQFRNIGTSLTVADQARGPANAILEVAAHCVSSFPNTKFLLSVAVDTPFFPSNFVQLASALLTPDLDVVVGVFDDNIYPTNALWRVSSLKNELENIVTMSPRSLFSLLDARRWVPLDYAKIQKNNPFINVNDHNDLELCNQIANRNRTNNNGDN